MPIDKKEHTDSEVVMREIKPGIYRHFKGNEYEVLGVARHSETEEEYVVYRALYGERGLWIRPLAMFAEPIDTEKYPDVTQVYRFEYVNSLVTDTN